MGCSTAELLLHDIPPPLIQPLDESSPVPKLSSVLVLAVTAVILSACTAADPDGSRPATDSESVSPPASETAGEPTPVPTRTASQEGPSTTPDPDPTGSSADREQPEEVSPTVDPLPAEPNDPFVPPPHGEPNPMAGNHYPNVPPESPHQGSPTDDAARSVAHPQPGYPGPSIVIASPVLRIGGHGYAPGEEIQILFAKPSTDYNLLSPNTGWPQAPVIAHAGPDGSYTFDIHISEELEPGQYGVMTWVPERNQDSPGAGEDSKRFLDVLLVE